MVKVISLSEKAYKTLKELKRKDESYSDIILVLSKSKKESLLKFAGILKDLPLEKIKKDIRKWRESYDST